jgi:o-succinylbenzoate synthase
VANARATAPVRAEVRRVAGPVTGIASSQRSWQKRRGLLLRLTDGDGRVGYGEASPLPGYSPDSLEACADVLERLATRPVPAVGDDLVDVASAVDELLPAAPLPAARCAIETALLDLLSQRQGVPISSLLAAQPAAHVPMAVLVPSSGGEAAMAAARRAWTAGIRTIKLKIGQPGRFADECQLISRLRGELGPDLQLRLDANGAWRVAQASDKLAALVAYAPEFVEQPVAGTAVLRLLAAPVPLAADEALHGGMDEAEAVVRSGACQVAILKPMVIGGLLRCRALANVARACGVAPVVSHLFDGPVARAAAAELALALGGARACGLGPHAALSIWPQVELAQFEAGHVRRSHTAGLGVAGGIARWW